MAPKKWPIHRKGTKYVVKPMSGEVPVLILLRDMLKIAQNKKEVKRAIHANQVLLNQAPVKDYKQGASLFDVFTIVSTKENYRLVLGENKKFALDKIAEKEANKKIAKVANKKTLNGKKVQLNLSDGKNFLSDLKCKTKDSVVVNLKENKIEKCLEFKEKAKVVVIGGKHTGESGVIEKIDEERKMVKVKEGDKSAQVLIKQIMVVE